MTESNQKCPYPLQWVTHDEKNIIVHPEKLEKKEDVPPPTLSLEHMEFTTLQSVVGSEDTRKVAPMLSEHQSWRMREKEE